MTSKYIIGLCVFLTIFISGIFYKSNYDEYIQKKLEVELLNSKLIKIDEENTKIKAQIRAKKDKKVDYVDKDKFEAISVSKNELKQFLYEIAIKTDAEILNMSSEVIYKKYDRYYLKYISLELNTNLENLYHFLYEINNSKIYIDTKNFNMSLKYGKFIISIGYIEKEEIN